MGTRHLEPFLFLYFFQKKKIYLVFNFGVKFSIFLYEVGTGIWVENSMFREWTEICIEFHNLHFVASIVWVTKVSMEG